MPSTGFYLWSHRDVKGIGTLANDKCEYCVCGTGHYLLGFSTIGSIPISIQVTIFVQVTSVANNLKCFHKCEWMPGRNAGTQCVVQHTAFYRGLAVAFSALRAAHLWTQSVLADHFVWGYWGRIDSSIKASQSHFGHLGVSMSLQSQGWGSDHCSVRMLLKDGFAWFFGVHQLHWRTYCLRDHILVPADHWMPFATRKLMIVSAICSPVILSSGMNV